MSPTTPATRLPAAPGTGITPDTVERVSDQLGGIAVHWSHLINSQELEAIKTVRRMLERLGV